MQASHLGCLCSARAASLELAFRTLKNEPMWSRVAHVAVPKYQCCVGLDHLKSVLALSRLRHLQVIQVSCLYFSSRDAYDLLCSFVGEVSVSRSQSAIVGLCTLAVEDPSG